jgi:ribosome-associated toxin RatA of RatAB toxin-antitoxin module
MIEINRSALLPYSARQLFELVSEISAYPDYIPGCTGAKLLGEWEQGIEAELTVSALGVKQSFATRNTVIDGQEIRMELLNGPLQHLVGRWLFKSLSDCACKIELSLVFETTGSLKRIAAKQLVERSSTTVVDALIQQAHQSFGRAS